MPIHSLHIFDRKGKTLFTKRYIPNTNTDKTREAQEEHESEQRKLVFGMLFSLREIITSLTPAASTAAATTTGKKSALSTPAPNATSTNSGGVLQSIQTGASTLFTYETNSGLLFTLYTTPITSDTSSGAASNMNSVIGGVGVNTSVHQASNVAAAAGVGGGNNNANNSSNSIPDKAVQAALHHMYNELWIQCVTRSPLYDPIEPQDTIQHTNFEVSLDAFLKAQTWF